MAYEDSIAMLEERFRGEIRRNEPLADYTTFGIGGPADLLLLPKGMDDLVLLAQAAIGSGAGLQVLGRGSNVLVSDAGYRGVVAVLSKGLCRIKQKGKDEVYVECGCDLNRLVGWCVENGLGGLENLAGIPGTVGGAVRMNAGALGSTIGEVVDEVSILRLEEGEVKERALTPAMMGFRYRETNIEEHEIIYQVKLKMFTTDRSDLDSRRRNALEWRRDNQPLDRPSAGSVFRNPEGVSAGELIERCGLKGSRAGEAMVSEKHANFIVNLGGAKATDVYELVTRIKEVVLQKEGIELREEIKLLGDIRREGP